MNVFRGQSVRADIWVAENIWVTNWNIIRIYRHERISRAIFTRCHHQSLWSSTPGVPWHTLCRTRYTCHELHMHHERTYYLYIGTIKVFDLRRQVSHDTLSHTLPSLTLPRRLSSSHTPSLTLPLRLSLSHTPSLTLPLRPSPCNTSFLTLLLLRLSPFNTSSYSHTRPS